MERGGQAGRKLGAGVLTKPWGPREAAWLQVEQADEPWDVVVIGGGATGVSVAFDAATRGLKTLLIEQFDFGKGTSSRSTKLIHGGVRYLKQGNLPLVRESLRERALLIQNAPHEVKPLEFVIPCRHWLEQLYYATGLRLYDLLAGRDRVPGSSWLSRKKLNQRLQTLVTPRFRGGISYFDGQFDDARLLISLAKSARTSGATLLNYCRVTDLGTADQRGVRTLLVEDRETKQSTSVLTRCVVNATGPFTDDILRQVEPDSKPMVAASQGVHLVLDRKFLPGESALMVPSTSDGRVLFCIPWHGSVLVGTTDTAIDAPMVEPRPQRQEIDFLLATAAEYLDPAPKWSDIKSVFTGIRPLVRAEGTKNTSRLSRDHSIRTSNGNVITICGGKWTTVRQMAEDCVDRVLVQLHEPKRDCVTRDLWLDGHPSKATGEATSPSDSNRSDSGDSSGAVSSEPGMVTNAGGQIPTVEMVTHWIQDDFARTVEDVLARRSRLLFLDVAQARQQAPSVAAAMSEVLGRDAAWVDSQLEEFGAIADSYDPAKVAG